MKLIDLGTLEKIKAETKNIPEKPKTQFTKTQALDFLKSEIELLLTKNYSLEDIVEFLDKRGFSVSLTTLKAFLKSSFLKSKSGSAQKGQSARSASKKE